MQAAVRIGRLGGQAFGSPADGPDAAVADGGGEGRPNGSELEPAPKTWSSEEGGGQEAAHGLLQGEANGGGSEPRAGVGTEGEGEGEGEPEQKLSLQDRRRQERQAKAALAETADEARRLAYSARIAARQARASAGAEEREARRRAAAEEREAQRRLDAAEQAAQQEAERAHRQRALLNVHRRSGQASVDPALATAASTVDLEWQPEPPPLPPARTHSTARARPLPPPRGLWLPREHSVPRAAVPPLLSPRYNPTVRGPPHSPPPPRPPAPPAL
jgi:hypothetical protein